MQDLLDYFAPIHFKQRHASRYSQQQIGKSIVTVEDEAFNLDQCDLVLIGCGERRGADDDSISDAPDTVRKQLYKMYNWHPSVKVADLGNIIQGNTVEDTRAALTHVLHELRNRNKNVLIIGGSHDLTLSQYNSFALDQQLHTATIVDMLVDLDDEEAITHHSFLMDMITAQPNHLRHLNQLGFQSYYASPQMLETLDKLRFDFVRVGKIKENMEEAEPALRGSHYLSFDMNAIRHCDAPANVDASPNGFAGDEACQILRYAGMSQKMQSVGIYGYEPEYDQHEMTAKLISQMIWYYIDGIFVRQQEYDLSQEDGFKQFHVHFTNNDTIFLKSKATGRWWMKLPNGVTIPCSYQDYLDAANDQIPERWLREQERLV